MTFRTLTDDELVELSQDNDRRLNEFAVRGVQLVGVNEHYTHTLLEELAGIRGTAAAREAHHLWLKEKLDDADVQVASALARQRLGINGNGAGHA